MSNDAVEHIINRDDAKRHDATVENEGDNSHSSLRENNYRKSNFSRSGYSRKLYGDSIFAFRISSKAKRRYFMLALNGHLHKSYMSNQLRRLFNQIIRDAEAEAGLKPADIGEVRIREKDLNRGYRL